MTQYETVASLGVDPRDVWIDPDGAGRVYSDERKIDLRRALNADGTIAHVSGETWATRAGVYLRAAGERTKVWKALHPEFDPKDELMVRATGEIVKRDQGLNPWVMGAIVIGGAFGVAFLPGIIAGAGAGGAATAGSATAAATTGVSSTVGAAIATGSSIALGVYQTHQQAEAQQQAQAAAIAAQRVQQAQAQASGSLFGFDTTTLLAIGAIIVVAFIARR